MDGERGDHQVLEEKLTSESVETCTSYFQSVRFLADSGHSWQTLHAVLNIFTTWVSHMVTSKGYELWNRFQQQH